MVPIICSQYRKHASTDKEATKPLEFIFDKFFNDKTLILDIYETCNIYYTKIKFWTAYVLKTTCANYENTFAYIISAFILTKK